MTRRRRNEGTAFIVLLWVLTGMLGILHTGCGDDDEGGPRDYFRRAPDVNLSATCTGEDETSYEFIPGEGEPYTLNTASVGYTATYRVTQTGMPDTQLTIRKRDENKFDLSGSMVWTDGVESLTMNVVGGGWIGKGCTDGNGYVRIGGIGFDMDGTGSVEGMDFSAVFSADFSFDPWIYTATGTNLPVTAIATPSTSGQVGDRFVVRDVTAHIDMSMTVSMAGHTEDVCSGGACSNVFTFDEVAGEVVDIEPVVVDAGSFQAVKIYTEFKDMFGDVVLTDTRWFDPDAGQVKWEVEDFGMGLSQTGVMVSWHQ